MDADTADDDELHRAALRHVGRALALDPDNSTAAELLRQLLLREPKGDPPEVQRAAAETDAEMRRNAVNFLFWRSLLWTACVPLTLWVGYTRPVIAGIAAAAILVTMLALAVLRRRPAISDATGLGLLGVTTMLFGSMSVLFGPFILVPSLAATNSIFFVLHSRPGQRLVIILAGVAAVMLPFVAEWIGIVPPSYVFEAGGMLVQPRVMAIDETRTTALLALLHVVLAIAPTVIALRVRDELLAAQRKLSLSSWRLGQLATDLRDVLTDDARAA
jgi:serine/threonine-protein kinase